jgi:diguanylate cyclase (GGDEF)-like protein
MHALKIASAVLPARQDDDATMFALAPVSLWLNDFSGVKVLFEEWRGVTSLREFLNEDLERVKTCARLIRIVDVNRKTLTLFEAEDVVRLTANLDSVFRDDMLVTYLDELVQLWEGQTEFSSNTVNYTLSGRRLDVQLKGKILPGFEDDWARVLVAIEDVTDRESARTGLAASEAYARGLFHHSPVSLWVEDFSAIKQLIDEVRACGIVDFRTFLFGAADKSSLLLRLRDVFRGAMQQHFREQLIDLWQGKLFQQREVVNHSLAGDELHLHLQFSVLPGHESDWSLVQVALTDITARKKAEAYLEFLDKHDVLTKLYNRSFYVDEINRLERAGLTPTTIIVADLNGLKAANDHLGHAVGDEMLRRAGEILGKVVEKPAHAARIGGDEFAILLPAVDERAGAVLAENIQKMIDLNNQFYSGPPLSFAIGTATSRAGERLEDVVKRADELMYKAKHAYYTVRTHD